MSGNYRVAASINRYGAIINAYIPVLALSSNTAVVIFNFLSAPAYNIVHIQAKVSLYPFLSQLCGVNFIQIRNQIRLRKFDFYVNAVFCFHIFCTFNITLRKYM
jgi:hypothetical protein